MYIKTVLVVFVYSARPSDPTFVEVKKYQRQEMKVDDTKEKYFDVYHPEEVENMINTQRRVLHIMRNNKMKLIFDTDLH